MAQVKKAKKDKRIDADNRVEEVFTENSGDKNVIVNRELGKFRDEIKQTKNTISPLHVNDKVQKRFILEGQENETIERLRESLEKIRSDNDSLLACANELNSQIDDLQDENDVLKYRKRQDKEILKRGEQERDRLVDRLSGALSELDFIKFDKDDLISELDKAQEKIEELEEKLEDTAEAIT